ncbi:hypothetical protein B0A66_14095 [Flavobacterium hercynium]|uniref:Uncharacterized protein n=1 Tax=Flavobacterium hercynium TaxID=387094 RepID=A0A226H7L8_9FLAO|nr:hypothetical protein B0A66_14095 [Flavobacterium hercynium]
MTNHFCNRIISQKKGRSGDAVFCFKAFLSVDLELKTRRKSLIEVLFFEHKKSLYDRHKGF